MPSVGFQAHYWYSDPGKSGKTGTSMSGTVASKSETLVMQKIRDRHKGKEIVLKEIKWK